MYLSLFTRAEFHQELIHYTAALGRFHGGLELFGSHEKNYE